MKKMILMMFLFCALPALAVGHGERAVPAGADLQKFPLFKGKLTVADQARLGLHPVRLEKSLTIHNEHKRLHGDGRWVLETLPIGRIVLADKNDNARYIEDCGNRIEGQLPCPQCPEVVPPLPINPPIVEPIPERGRIGFWESLGDALKAAANSLWGGLGDLLRALWWLLLLLLPLLLLAFLIYALVDYLRYRRETREERKGDRWQKQVDSMRDDLKPPPSRLAAILPWRRRQAQAAEQAVTPPILPPPVTTPVVAGEGIVSKPFIEFKPAEPGKPNLFTTNIPETQFVLREGVVTIRYTYPPA